MKTFNENMTLSNFEAWAGAKDTRQTILDANLGDEFDALIEELYPDGLSETQLNDILWFEEDWIYESLGMVPDEEEEGEEEEEEVN